MWKTFTHTLIRERDGDTDSIDWLSGSQWRMPSCITFLHVNISRSHFVLQGSVMIKLRTLTCNAFADRNRVVIVKGLPCPRESNYGTMRNKSGVNVVVRHSTWELEHIILSPPSCLCTIVYACMSSYVHVFCKFAAVILHSSVCL